MLEYESNLIKSGYKCIAGVDEAGRGPLAGPVYAAAVILRPGFYDERINDSKKLSPKTREILFKVICESALSYSISSVSEQIIDRINILQATMLAMQQAVEGLTIPADYVIIDGNRAPNLSIPCETIIRGDSKSLSIAAASILAKVARDHYMEKLDALYPQYLFIKHKGYGTSEHIQKIRENGICVAHRKSFLKKII